MSYSLYTPQFHAQRVRNNRSLGRQCSSMNLSRNFSQATIYIVKNFRVGPAFFIASAIVFVALLSIITLFFSTNKVTKGYVLRDLESKRQVLLRDNEIKTMQAAQAQALQVVLASERVDRMVNARNITYMRGDTMMAAR